MKTLQLITHFPEIIVVKPEEEKQKWENEGFLVTRISFYPKLNVSLS